jgi:ribosomal protein L35
MKSHNLEKKSSKRRRSFGKVFPVDPADVPALKKMLGKG